MQSLKLKCRIGSFFMLIIGCHVTICGQIAWDFEQGGLPGWFLHESGSWACSGVDPLQGEVSLKHVRDASVAGMDFAWLGTDSLRPDLGPCTWSFSLRHGHDPSSVNRWAVYLVCNTDSASRDHEPTQGIAVAVNYRSSNDVVELIAIREGEKTTVINSGVDWTSGVGISSAVDFTVRRHPGGTWELVMDRRDGEGTRLAMGTGEETWLPEIRSFGIGYRYTSQQDRKLWFDGLRIDGVFRPDTLAPGIRSVVPVQDRSLLVELTEIIDTGSLERGSFMLAETGEQADSLAFYGNSLLWLHFSNGFVTDRTNTLIIRGMQDIRGNRTDSLSWPFFYHRALRGELVINEVLADPDPAVGLPAGEYVELYNNGPFAVDTRDWTLASGSRQWTLDPVTIRPGGFLVLCRKGQETGYGQVNATGIFNGASSLPNDGGSLVLKDFSGMLISCVTYNPGWHTDAFRQLGGWSLERIDPLRFCGGGENWTSANDPSGGTPGRENSVRNSNPDRSLPYFCNAWCSDPFTVEVEFTEAMDAGSLADTRQFQVDRGMGFPLASSTGALPADNVSLTFGKPFKEGVVYRLGVSAGTISDCNGNRLPVQAMIEFGPASDPAGHEILINEVLFNPLPGCVDYIELYNDSRHVFDLSDLRLASRDAGSGDFEGVCVVSEKHRLFLPGHYLVESEDAERLALCYYVRDPGTSLETGQLPAMDDHAGTVTLLDRHGSVIDEFTYSESMHFGLLDVREGISLERLSFAAATNDPGNWHSASEASGFGTPGYENSQRAGPSSTSPGFTIARHAFSPDQDGQEDVLNISYTFRQAGTVYNVLVFDPRGRFVCRLADRELAGMEGLVSWDGLTGDGRLARTGMYLILIEWFGPDGRRKRSRDYCILR